MSVDAENDLGVALEGSATDLRFHQLYVSGLKSTCEAAKPPLKFHLDSINAGRSSNPCSERHSLRKLV